MRILYLFMLLFFMVTGLLIVLYAFNSAMVAMKEGVDELIENVSAGFNVSVEQYDIAADLSPYIKALNYALIVGFLAAIVGVFIYVRRRD